MIQKMHASLQVQSAAEESASRSVVCDWALVFDSLESESEHGNQTAVWCGFQQHVECMGAITVIQYFCRDACVKTTAKKKKEKQPI